MAGRGESTQLSSLGGWLKSYLALFLMRLKSLIAVSLPPRLFLILLFLSAACSGTNCRIKQFAWNSSDSMMAAATANAFAAHCGSDAKVEAA